MKFLVTGVAGFIGYHISIRLLVEGYQVIGIDNLNDYYDVCLKKARLKKLLTYDMFFFHKLDLADRQGIASLFFHERFDRVIHLGAQAGVQYSLKNPLSYGDSNLIGYINILEGCRNVQVAHLLYASSSSVYGLNRKLPFSTQHSADHPVSLYAATKKANELMAHVYSHLYQLPTTGLRFFTVYGPWGRPDMALSKFTQAILKREYIDLNNYGDMLRDFTYIDDIVEVIFRLRDVIPELDSTWTVEVGPLGSSSAPYRIYNVGNSQSIKLIDYIQVLEDTLGIQAKKNFVPMQPGEVLETNSDTETLYQKVGFKPQTPVKEGIKKFIKWYREYYHC